MPVAGKDEEPMTPLTILINTCKVGFFHHMFVKTHTQSLVVMYPTKSFDHNTNKCLMYILFSYCTIDYICHVTIIGIGLCSSHWI